MVEPIEIGAALAELVNAAIVSKDHRVRRHARRLRSLMSTALEAGQTLEGRLAPVEEIEG